MRYCNWWEQSHSHTQAPGRKEEAAADVNSDYSCRLNLLSCQQTAPEALCRSVVTINSRPGAHNAI